MPSTNLIPRQFLRRFNEQVASPNERRILDWVRRNPGETRARIMHELDLSAQSVSRLTDTLEKRGLIEQGERVISGRGQPSVALSLTQNAAYTVGISIMTDAISLVFMNFRGEIVYQHRSILASMDQAATSMTSEEGPGRQFRCADYDGGIPVVVSSDALPETLS